MQKKIKDDTIYRQDAIDALDALCDRECEYSKKQRSFMCSSCHLGSAIDVIERVPSAQPERLTDDDLETIRIHLSAYKEKLCNQRRWKEAEEYQRTIDRFMKFASAHPEQRWIPCSERLPEKADGQYWVCTDTEYQCQCRWTDNVYGLGSNGEWAWKIFDIPQYSHVIAWMPLPEPYWE